MCCAIRHARTYSPSRLKSVSTNRLSDTAHLRVLLETDAEALDSTEAGPDAHPDKRIAEAAATRVTADHPLGAAKNTAFINLA